MRIAQNDRRVNTTHTSNIDKFTNLGCNMKIEKLCNNIMAKFMFNIPIEQVTN